MSTVWDLPSGRWQSSPSGEQASFARVDLPPPVAALSTEQRRSLGLLGAFPPDFRFDPTTGQPLAERATVIPWTTPDGGHAINPNYVGFGIDAVTQFSDLDAAASSIIASPGNGQFEFVVGSFNTGSEQLLAINVKDYVLKLWLVDEWVELHCHSDLVPEGFPGTKGWRAELFEDPGEPSRLYVPGHDRLYVLQVDASSLSFGCAQLAPPDCTRLCGPPMAWLEGLLFPYVDASGHVALAQVDDERRPGDLRRVATLSEASAPADARLWFQVAVSKKNRLAVWVSDDKVLQFNRAWRGYRLQSMPAGYRAGFESLKPFIDANESFWVLVASDRDVCYLHLGQRAEPFETRPSERVFACAGQRFFRRDLIFERNDPWSESNQEKDSRSTAHHYPLVEFLMSAERPKPAAGLTIRFDTLDAPEPWASVYQDTSREFFFELCFDRTPLTRGKRAGLAERARAFVYHRRLWCYEGPGVPLQGWRLLE